MQIKFVYSSFALLFICTVIKGVNQLTCSDQGYSYVSQYKLKDGLTAPKPLKNPYFHLCRFVVVTVLSVVWEPLKVSQEWAYSFYQCIYLYYRPS